MLLEDLFLENAKVTLIALAEGHSIEFPMAEFPWDPFVAKSLMQKSIRRGDVINALLAARFLLRIDERGFWRRLCIIALEDIGVANIPLVAQVLISEKDRALRKRLENIGEALVAALCCSKKDRSTDDLIDTLGAPEHICANARMAELTKNELLDVLSSGSACITDRAIAASHLTQATTPAERAKEWCRMLELLPEDVLSPGSKVTAQIGAQRTKSEMALYMALLSKNSPISGDGKDDQFPEARDLHGLPSWVLDGHTRLGLQAFRLFIKRSSKMAKLIDRYATGSVSPAKVVAGLVFRTESHLLADRLDWGTGHQLRDGACSNRPGLSREASAEGLDLVAHEFALVNECRSDAVRNYLR